MDASRTGRALVALVVALALATVACGGSKAGAPARSSSTTTVTAASPLAGRPYRVTRREVTVEDTSRPTAADPNRSLPAKSTRTLPLVLLVPDGRGPFPVVEFSHGHTASASVYAPFLEPVAAAGYVVVLPTFPLSSGPGAGLSDYVNQPADAYFALDAVIRMGKDPKDPLHGRVDAQHIALAGHSLGAITTIGAAYNSCCTQARVDAAISLSGIELPFPGGDFTNRPKIPLLLGHGDADARVPISGSDNLYAAATGPVAYLRINGGSHSGIFLGDQGALVRKAMIAWLDRWLYGDHHALDALPAAVRASGIATFQTRGY